MAMSSFSFALDYIKGKSFHRFRDLNTDRTDEEPIEGKIVIVTGSNSGIGKEAAIQFARRGAVVIMACRDMEKAEKVVNEIKSMVENAQLVLMKLDLGDLSSIETFVKEFKGKYDKLHILVNNAGIMDTNGTVKKTKDGFELHIGINHLGGFLLTRMLLDVLKASEPSRIVCTSSSNLALAQLDWDDLMMEKNPRWGDEGREPYNISKLAAALAMRELGKKLEGSGVCLYNVCPGFVKTDAFRYEESKFRAAVYKVKLAFVGITAEQGCETIILCATNKDMIKENAKMFRFTKYWQPSEKALNDEDCKKMWDVTEALLKDQLANCPM